MSTHLLHVPTHACCFLLPECKRAEAERKKSFDAKYSLSFVMPTCSRSSLRGQRAAGTAESVRTGQQPSGERSLRTVRVHSRRIRQPAFSLQRQPHCSTNQDERQLERRGGDKQRGKRMRGQAAALIPPQQSPNEADSSPCLSLQLPHNFSSPSPLLAICHSL